MFCKQIIDVPLDQLVTWRGYKNQTFPAETSIYPYDRAVASAPHYHAVRSFDAPEEPNVVPEYVRHFERLIAAGKTRRNHGELIVSGQVRLERFRDLYNEIRYSRRIDPIRVVAEHDGRFRIRDGHHRAAISLHLGLPTIPAKIVRVDRELKKLISDVFVDRHRRRLLYQPIEHPVFQDWPTKRFEDRWHLMQPQLKWAGESVLDIGSFTGYFSRSMARAGANVTGAEKSVSRLSIALSLNKLFDTNVSYLNQDFREVVSTKKFDAVIFLSVLHWILKRGGLPAVRECLEAISASSPVMFLDLATIAERKMRWLKWNHGIVIDRHSIPQLVLSNSNYKFWKELGVDQRGRPLFVFWRVGAQVQGHS